MVRAGIGALGVGGGSAESGCAEMTPYYESAAAALGWEVDAALVAGMRCVRGDGGDGQEGARCCARALLADWGAGLSQGEERAGAEDAARAQGRGGGEVRRGGGAGCDPGQGGLFLAHRGPGRGAGGDGGGGKAQPVERRQAGRAAAQAADRAIPSQPAAGKAAPGEG